MDAGFTRLLSSRRPLSSLALPVASEHGVRKARRQLGMHVYMKLEILRISRLGTLALTFVLGTK